MAAAKEQLHAFVREHIPKGIPVQHVVTCGTIYEEILTFARQHSIDLIVMASHRPELSDYLLGPNAARVTRHAACPVMVVRASREFFRLAAARGAAWVSGAMRGGARLQDAGHDRGCAPGGRPPPALEGRAPARPRR